MVDLSDDKDIESDGRLSNEPDSQRGIGEKKTILLWGMRPKV